MTALLSLPHAVVLHIFSLLPVDCRLRCTEVCRGWRSVLLARSLWTRLDLTAASGVRVPREYETRNALLRCAAARAGGTLQSLQVDSCFKHATLLEVAAANAGALRELHLRNGLGLGPETIDALLCAAPLLDVFAGDLCCNGTNLPTACRMLRNEAPFGSLRLRRLQAYLHDEAGVLALAADVAAHASLRGLSLNEAPLRTAAALDAVVDAALARQLQTVTLDRCGLSPASAPALARLLGGGALTTLECVNMDMMDAPSAAVLAAALRGNATLTSLTLNKTNVFYDADAGVELLGALTGHPSLQTLNLQGNYTLAARKQAALGASFGALIAADAALTQLDVSMCGLADDGLRPLFEALPRNTHLRELDCYHNGARTTIVADTVLPAVRANTHLRSLDVGFTGAAGLDTLRELLAQRRR
jgi:hypothetical protein